MQVLGTSPLEHRHAPRTATSSPRCSTRSASTSRRGRSWSPSRRRSAFAERRRLPGPGPPLLRAERRGDGRGLERARAGRLPAEGADVSPEHPVVMSKFIENAKEIEIDAVACRRRAARLRHQRARRERRRPLRATRRWSCRPSGPISRRCAGSGRSRAQIAQALEHPRSVQHPVHRQGQRREGHRVQPAGLAELSLRLEDPAGRTSSSWPPRSCMGQPDATATPRERVAPRPRLRRRQGAAVLLHPAGGRRPDARRRDGVDRRGRRASATTSRRPS